MNLPGTWHWIVQPAIYYFRGTGAASRSLAQNLDEPAGGA